MEKSTITLSKRKSNREYILFIPILLPVILLLAGVFPAEKLSSVVNILYFLYLLGTYSWYLYLFFARKLTLETLSLPMLMVTFLVVISIEAIFMELESYFLLVYGLVFLVAGILFTWRRLLLFLAFTFAVYFTYMYLFKVEEPPEILLQLFLYFVFAFLGNIIFFRERIKRLEIESAYKKLEREAQELGGITLGDVDNPIDLLSRKSLSQQTLQEKKQQQNEILNTLHLVKRSIKPFSVIFFVYSRKKDLLFPWLYVSDGEVNEEVTYRPGEGLIGQVLTSKGQVHLSELFSPLRGIDYYKKKESIKSFLGIKVIRDNVPLGVLIVDSKIEQAFHEEHAKLLEMASYQIMFILENSDIRKQLKIELQRSRALYELTRLFNSTLDLEELGSMVLRLLADLTSFDFGFIGVRVDDSHIRVFAAMGEYEDRVKGKDLSIHRTLAGELFKNPVVCKVSGKRRKEKIPVVERGFFPERDYSAILCIPLPVRNETVGVMLLFSRNEDSFTLYERRILEVIGSQLALTIRNAQLYQQMEQLAIKDGLTGLYNRRYFEEQLATIYREVERYGYELSVIMMDIDHFKKINDTYGHQVGDIVLRRVAALLMEEIRDVDFPARYGGEEFVVVLKFARERDACKIAERIRKRISREKIEYSEGEFLQVTVSCGVASTSSGVDVERLVELADEALYYSKEHGRNRVTCYGKMKK